MAAKRISAAVRGLAATGMMVTGMVQAQTPVPGPQNLPPPNTVPMSATAPQVTAATDLPVMVITPAFRFMPSIELNERYSDNAALLSSSLARSDWVTDLIAGLRIEYRAARASAQVDYRIDRPFHREFTNLDNTQRFLNSHATLEAVEKWLFVDASATITQQNRSAFGVTNISDINNVSANRIETTTYQLSPYIRGDLGTVATYQLRLNEADTRTGETTFPDTKTRQWSGFAKNQPSSGWLGWAVDGSSLAVDNPTVGRRDDSRARASLTFEVDSQLHLSLSGGRESSDLDGLQRRNTNTYGYGIEWSPSQRTQFAAVTQKRFFGNDHLVLLNHRTALTAWRFSSSKEVAISTNELAGSNALSVNNLLLDLLASSVPDPAMRAAASRQRFDQTGIPASSGIQDGFLSVRPFLSERQEGSLALVGQRNTITFDVSYRKQRALDGNTVTPNGAAPVEEIKQLNANAVWAYRLSPLSTLKLVASRLYTEGLFLPSLNSTQRLQSLFFVTQLGPHTYASLGVQRISFDSTVLPSYRENAFVSSLSLRF
ncbi:MAG: TIGR03016 family PEP-CTERM system-associated outer membrane protein [Betaproteobacteria bacterium]